MSPPARQMSNLIFDKKILWVKEKRSTSFVIMDAEGYWEQSFWLFASL